MNPTNTISVNKLAGTRVLVIGGTSGIGFAVARAALEHGASVFLASSQARKVDDALTRLRTLYPDPGSQSRIAGGCACNLGDPATSETHVRSLLEQATTTTSTTGKTFLDHIVYTAGDALGLKPVTDPTLTVADIHAAGTVRVLGALMVAKHARSYMRVSARSSITFTSGVNGHRPARGWALAAASGGAVEGMARGLAVDLAPVRVNTVSPSAVLTELFDTFGDEEAKLAAVERYAEETLVGEIGRPEEVAEAYVYLMKDRFVTGTVVHSEGGKLLK
ncbi:oxidoreductase, short chain dehydrogenase/reductase family [Aspergillus aculeatinus CBS 121060]|uniref:Oxidoreductase n=1 Tax=Aspergillus aculeatinus CBS 121060 TaxID=1448322 RepID=A0ACD1H6V6_9EURO|nr:oxidoreductase [Aspergillus aculeatinus CBS 121060]RAH69236.1 oxidoreductase [Aspergillus aculeatinus CBS 121060]